MKKFFYSIGIKYVQLTFPRKKNNQKFLTNFFNQSKKAIIITPTSSEQKKLSIPLLQWLQKKFSSHHLTIITFDTFSDIAQELEPCNVLTILPEHKNLFGFLNSTLLNQLNPWKTDTIIDLSFEEDPTILNILKGSHFDISIGFNKNGAEKFYTIIVKPGANPFEQMKNTLSMF